METQRGAAELRLYQATNGAAATTNIPSFGRTLDVRYIYVGISTWFRGNIMYRHITCRVSLENVVLDYMPFEFR